MYLVNDEGERLRLSIGLEARNLWLFYKKVPHIDPEMGLFGSAANGQGVKDLPDSLWVILGEDVPSQMMVSWGLSEVLVYLTHLEQLGEAARRATEELARERAKALFGASRSAGLAPRPLA